MDRARDHWSIAEAGLEVVRGFTHSYRRKANISSTMVVCTICLGNNTSEAEVITETKKSRKVYHQIYRRPEQTAKFWIYLSETQEECWQTESKPSLRTSLYAGRMRCKNLSKNMEKKNFRRITYVSKGSDVTLRNALGTGITTFQACLGKPIVICRRGTVTQFHQRVAIGWTRKFKDKRSAYKALKNSQEWCSTVTDASHSITKEVIKKINKKMYIYFDSWSLPNNSIIHAVWRGTHPTTEGCGAPTLAIICMNWGSRSKSTIYISWWSSRSSNALFLSYIVGKGPYKGIIENQEKRKVGPSETHASGNREASSHNDWWKANWWNKYQQERSRRTWNGQVWEIL